MNITTRTGLVGFFLALSALHIPGAVAATSQPDATPDSHQPIESRLSRLTAAIRHRETLLPETTTNPAEVLIARAWINGGGGGWRNGGFLNSRPWVNGGWLNGGGWRNGGSFWNY